MRNLALGMLSASLMSALAAIPAEALTITTSANCTLAEAIESANTNAAVGGCTAGAAGRDRIVVNINETLSVASSGDNGLPIVTEDLHLTTSGGTRLISRDYTVGTANFRFLEIGSSTTPVSVTISGISLQNGARHRFREFRGPGRPVRWLHLSPQRHAQDRGQRHPGMRRRRR